MEDSGCCRAVGYLKVGQSIIEALLFVGGHHYHNYGKIFLAIRTVVRRVNSQPWM